jgi:hypothetical protein
VWPVHEDVGKRGLPHDGESLGHAHLRALNATHDSRAIEELDRDEFEGQLFNLVVARLDCREERFLPCRFPA